MVVSLEVRTPDEALAFIENQEKGLKTVVTITGDPHISLSVGVFHKSEKQTHIGGESSNFVFFTTAFLRDSEAAEVVEVKASRWHLSMQGNQIWDPWWASGSTLEIIRDTPIGRIEFGTVMGGNRVVNHPDYFYIDGESFKYKLAEVENLPPFTVNVWARDENLFWSVLYRYSQECKKFQGIAQDYLLSVAHICKDLGYKPTWGEVLQFVKFVAKFLRCVLFQDTLGPKIDGHGWIKKMCRRNNVDLTKQDVYGVFGCKTPDHGPITLDSYFD